MTTAAATAPNVNDPDGSFGQELAAEIRAEIARLGMSRRRLALDIGREPSWLTKRLAGVIPMTTNDVESIATALGTSPVALVLATPSGRRVAQQSITAR
ncbi:helix-turn-helix domain-containing protein [Pseudonocardia sp. TMWB2A]|uniref:helix-turn-helix domain-containing protein n=1 Tax=Pseudonocardia sp. TMWB2A TaxID=687430 RepID=UPI00307D88B4